MFFVSILFCRKGIYHPEELGKTRRDVLDELGRDRPVAAAVLIMLMLAGYAYYQSRNPDPCSTAAAQENPKVQEAPERTRD